MNNLFKGANSSTALFSTITLPYLHPIAKQALKAKVNFIKMIQSVKSKDALMMRIRDPVTEVLEARITNSMEADAVK